ncbi:HD-like signal output (HDOD) protein [Natronocella acetinitrilica]|uniref:HD-like signal output (HDOD) protein n=1 Tax=Natronocella acetinitrilica TaxID=414046 RepID=A0AAE3G007_9GAMM|nr:HDOD domain-containing protein [Natronocella acetinitrilica]MCP1673060.1 HD-like signal output (HDOD) protein [Natronocella acetinitrilica]
MSPPDIKKLDALPALPRAVQEIFHVVNDKDAPLSAVAEALGRDPATVARIVAAANAAFFVGHHTVYTVDDAAVRLGLNRVRVLATSTLLASRFRPQDCPAFDQGRFWLRAMSVAMCASKLANYVPLETPSSAAYLAGLLHHCGVLALAYAYPRECERPLMAYEVDRDSRRLDDRLSEVLGFGHHAAGAHVLRNWGVPEAAAAIAESYSQDDYDGDYARLQALIRTCIAWYREGYGDMPDSPLLRTLPDTKIANIGASCRREDDQLRSFALQLASAA